jgi:hypothetical protein
MESVCCYENKIFLIIRIHKEHKFLFWNPVSETLVCPRSHLEINKCHCTGVVLGNVIM